MWTTWLLAIGSLVIGFGPLVFRRPTPVPRPRVACWRRFFWVSGQGLGGIFTGSGTDPNTGPLIVLLALAMVPAALPDAGDVAVPVLDTRSFGYPVFVLGGLVALVVGPVPQRRLPGAGPGVDRHGDGRHDRHVRGDVGFGRGDCDHGHLYTREQRRAEDRAGHPTTHRTWSWPGRAPA